MSQPFVHLHCHTHYSLLDGANRIPELVQHVKAQGMNAVAITDHGNLYGAIEFYQACRAAGINPIIGYEAYVAPQGRKVRGGKRGDAANHLTLLAKNRTGFQNLIKLASIASLEGYYYVPRIDNEVLEAHHEGLICLSGCASALFSEHILADRKGEAEKTAAWFHKLFGKDFYVEIQNNGIEIQKLCASGAIEIANKMGLPLVATSDAHYLTREDAVPHDILLCINTGKTQRDPDRMRYGNGDGKMIDQFHVCGPEEIYKRFPRFEEAVKRTQEIADGVDIQLDFKKRYFPAFKPPAEKVPEDYLREVAYQGLYERYGKDPSAEAIKRLEYELSVVCKMGFASYFLIVWDFVRFARERGIPCGARGSGVGAIISYVLYLSHVCPLEYDLLFERFLDPNRAEAPDIDMDLCQDRREEVLEYVREKYGKESVAQIATFGTLAAKAALKDVARALGIPLPEADRMTKMVPTKVGTTLDDCLAQVPEIMQAYQTDGQVRNWFDIARRIEGTNRNVGTHAAGVVISEGPLVNHAPLQKAPRKGETAHLPDAVTTQWPMEALEKVGLLKMDFLGLRTLTVVNNTIKMIERTRGEIVDLQKIPRQDPKTLDLLRKGDTKGVFQLESDGIRELLKRIQPDSVRDLIATNALYRPGPINGGMVDAYVNRKHGREKPRYEHPIMEEVLRETYGVLTYQEQIMRILNRLGGIELAAAYTCIKAISKKKQEIIDQRRDEFVAGSVAKGVAKEAAEAIFGLIEQFGAYGFNKSHATAYADLGYKTAYLKANYTNEFLSAVLTSEMHDRDKLTGHINDAKRLGVPVLPPDVNVSDVEFTVNEKGCIVFGLAAIKNLGLPTAKAVVQARAEGGVFTDLDDMAARVPTAQLGKGPLELLVKAGACDSLLGEGQHRAQLLSHAEVVAGSAKVVQKDRRRGQGSLFDTFNSDDESNVAVADALPNVRRWTPMENLRYEREALDMYLSSHPLAQHAGIVNRFTSHDIADLLKLPDKTKVIVAGILEDIKYLYPKSGKGNRYMRCRVSDPTGSIESITWSSELEKMAPDLSQPDEGLLLAGHVERTNGDVLIIQEACPFQQAPQRMAKALYLQMSLAADAAIIDRLHDHLVKWRGQCPVYLIIRDANGQRLTMRLGMDYWVDPRVVMVDLLEGIIGSGNAVFAGVGRKR